MIAQCFKYVAGDNDKKCYLPCGIEEVTHLRFKFRNEDGERMLPVMTKGTRHGTGNWTWNGSLTAPTLKPSILTEWSDKQRCHVWINDGIVKHLGDCTDCGLANQSQPLDELEDR